ncbi:putative Transcription factor domain-containing protein [Seiridium cardinale]|uniref:Transcription factor domain-containing protein n=1 Tax=Seiridium cardinale TaxID=138064 RepID=A0ABR2Y271_9PEZI
MHHVQMQADDLLAWYWDFIHPLIPVLHRPGFMVRYDQLWQPRNVSTSSGAADDIIFHATLNMVLALGCQRNEQFEPAERANLSYEFYKRSVKIVSVDTLDESSLSVVQLLMLRGLYLLYSPYADRCWNMTAITIRIAQAIGLESLSYHSSSLDQLTREMRRRVWYSCIVLDRFTGLCFGRHQFLVSSSSIPLPSEIDDEYLSSFDEGRQPKNSSSRLTYFNQAFKLSTIGDRWQKLNDKHIQESTGRYSTQELGTIVDIYAEIERYHEQLPAHLQGDGFSRAFEDSKCFKLQAHTLKARIIYMKLWSLRPCLISEVRRVTMPSSPHDIGGKRTTSEQLEQRLRDDVCTLCVVAAHDVLDELHRMLSGMQRTSPWHALFFTFAAASVLVVATLCPSLDVDLGQEPAKTSWTRATEIFQFHSRHVPSAEKGVAALEVLRRSVTLRKSELEKNECVVDAELGSLAAEIETEAPFQDEWLGFKDFIDPESLDFSWFTMQVCYIWFTNTSLTGVKLAACHTSASIESLCLFDGGNDSTYTFYFNTTAHTPDPGALHTGFVTWTLEAEVVGFNEPLTLLYNTASNLAFPMIWPSLDNVQQFAFTTEEHLAVPAYVNDAIEPPAPYRGRGMFWDNRWVVCHSYW